MYINHILNYDFLYKYDNLITENNYKKKLRKQINSFLTHGHSYVCKSNMGKCALGAYLKPFRFRNSIYYKKGVLEPVYQLSFLLGDARFKILKYRTKKNYKELNNKRMIFL